MYRIYEFIRKNTLLVGIIFVLVVMTGLFLVFINNNNSPEQEMKRDAKENIKIEQIKEKQQQERLGGEDFDIVTKELPTKEQIKEYLESQTIRIGDDYKNYRGVDEVYRHYDEVIGFMYEDGMLVSDSLTTDQKVVIMNMQENRLFRYQRVKQPLVGVDGVDFKDIYNVKNFLDSRPRVMSNQIIIYNNGEEIDLTGEEEPLLYLYSMNKEQVGASKIRYEVGLNPGEELIKGVRVSAIIVGEAYIEEDINSAVHLIVVPNQAYTYDEFKELFKGVSIKVDGEEFTFDDIYWEDYIGKVVNQYQMIRIKFNKKIEGFTEFNLKVNGKKVQMEEVTKETSFQLK